MTTCKVQSCRTMRLSGDSSDEGHNPGSMPIPSHYRNSLAAASVMGAATSMYSSLAVAFLCAFALSSVLTPVCRNAALRMNLVDRPDGARKLHRRPVPHVGGIPILLSIAAACACHPYLPSADTKTAAAALMLN